MFSIFYHCILLLFGTPSTTTSTYSDDHVVVVAQFEARDGRLARHSACGSLVTLYHGVRSTLKSGGADIGGPKIFWGETAENGPLKFFKNSKISKNFK